MYSGEVKSVCPCTHFICKKFALTVGTKIVWNTPYLHEVHIKLHC